MFFYRLFLVRDLLKKDKTKERLRRRTISIYIYTKNLSAETVKKIKMYKLQVTSYKNNI